MGTASGYERFKRHRKRNGKDVIRIEIDVAHVAARRLFEDGTTTIGGGSAKHCRNHSNGK